MNSPGIFPVVNKISVLVIVGWCMQKQVYLKERGFFFPESDTGRRIVDVQLMVTTAQRKF